MGQKDDLFWQLIERIHKRALAYSEHLAGNSSDGGDLYQDSVVKAFEGFEKLRQVTSFEPWFYRIINNTFRGRFRNPWWRRVASRFTEIENLEIAINPIDRIDARRRLDYALGALSADDRILVILAELEGWSIAEIAALNSKSEGLVKMRLLRAREKMRRRLGARFRKAPETETTMEGQEGYGMSSGATKTE
jgi:RNA polymerase sigma-70 factor (ECF subfamily)